MTLQNLLAGPTKNREQKRRKKKNILIQRDSFLNLMIQKPLQSSKGSCRIFKLNGDAHRDECLSIIERLDVHPKPAISPQQVNLQILLLALTATHRKPTLIIHLHAVTSNVNNMSNDFTQEIEKKKSKRKVKKKNSIRKSKKT